MRMHRCLSEYQSSFLKANHNRVSAFVVMNPVVYQNIKVRF